MCGRRVTPSALTLGFFLVNCTSPLSLPHDSVTDQSNLREQGMVYSGLQLMASIMVGKAWQQEVEATGHMVSTAMKQRKMDSGAHLFMHYKIQDQEIVLPTLEGGLPSSINLI